MNGQRTVRTENGRIPSKRYRTIGLDVIKMSQITQSNAELF